MVFFFFFFQAEDGIRDIGVTGVQTCALPIFPTGLPTRFLLDAAGGPGSSTAHVGDEAGYLFGSRIVRGYGEHRVLPGDGAHDLQAFYAVEDAGDRSGGTVAGVDNYLVLDRGDAEDEAGQHLDTRGAWLVRQRQVAMAYLQDAQLGEIPANCGLRYLHPLLS